MHWVICIFYKKYIDITKTLYYIKITHDKDVTFIYIIMMIFIYLFIIIIFYIIIVIIIIIIKFYCLFAFQMN